MLFFFVHLSIGEHLGCFHVLVVVDVTRVYVPQFFALSQQRFGVTDIKAPSAWIDHVIALRSRMDHVMALRQISVTAQCYSSIFFRR